MKVFGLTDKGLVRAENQDCYTLEEISGSKNLILVLCDGMGGANCGALASSVSMKSFVSYVRTRLGARMWRETELRQLLQEACDEANGITYVFSQFSEEYTGLGTTLVGGVLSENGHGCLVNVGDSRAYLLSARQKTIRQVTNDHSLVEAYVQAGMITREEARTHPQKNIITRAVGSEETVESDAYDVHLQKQDMLLLCSDGLSNYFTDEELLNQYLQTADPEVYCREMLRQTYLRGAGDNVTIVCVVRE